jgi:YVTN family beta-propeller protein
MAEAGRVLGDYEVVGELEERGGMAVVFAAWQPRLGRKAALKQVDLRGGGALAERFVREARLAASLNHPNVVTVFDFFEHEDVPYIAMEYLERGSLRPWMLELTLAQSLGVLEGMLAGLAHAHGHGIVHRDIKPENILVTEAGAIKLADFGIARAYANVTQRLTKTGMTVGTPSYMAPEQAMNQPIGPWTDLYATGVVAYEMLLRRLPFQEAEIPVAILLQHINDPIPPPRELDPTLDADIATWLQRMLAKSPKQRPESAHAAWEQLEDAAVHVIGPLWRRDARLLESSEPTESAKPLTPARFSSPPSPPEIDSEVQPNDEEIGDDAIDRRPKHSGKVVGDDTGDRHGDESVRLPPAEMMAEEFVEPERSDRTLPADEADAYHTYIDRPPPGEMSTDELAADLDEDGAATGPPAPDALGRRLSELVKHPDPDARVGAVEQLARLLDAPDPNVALAARRALDGMQDDDSRQVANRAHMVLLAGRYEGKAKPLSLGEAERQAGADQPPQVEGPAPISTPTARELKTTLAPHRPPPPDEAASPSSTYGATGFARLKRRTVLILGVGLALGLLAVTIVLVGQQRPEVESTSASDGPEVTPIRVGASPTDVAVGEGAVWVANGGEHTVSRIDPASNRIAGNPIPVSVPTDVAVGEGAVWVASDDTLLRIDPATNRIEWESNRLSEYPEGVAVGEGAVWVADRRDDRVSRIDPATNRIAGKPIPVGDGPTDVAIGEGAVWVANLLDGTVSRIDPATNRVAGKAIPVGDSPTDVAVGEGAVWVAHKFDDTVLRIDPATNRIAGKPIPVGDSPTDLAVGEGAVWVANSGDDAVSRIDPATNRVAGRPIPVGDSPEGVAVGEGALWVASSRDDTVSRIVP